MLGLIVSVTDHSLSLYFTLSKKSRKDCFRKFSFSIQSNKYEIAASVFPLVPEFSIYGRTSGARTLMAHLPRAVSN